MMINQQEADQIAETVIAELEALYPFFVKDQDQKSKVTSYFSRAIYDHNINLNLALEAVRLCYTHRERAPRLKAFLEDVNALRNTVIAEKNHKKMPTQKNFLEKMAENSPSLYRFVWVECLHYISSDFTQSCIKFFKQNHSVEDAQDRAKVVKIVSNFYAEYKAARKYTNNIQIAEAENT